MSHAYIEKFGKNPLPIGAFTTPHGTIRIVIGQGKKCKDDRTIYYQTVSRNGQPVPLMMRDLAALNAIICHNESVNYPPETGKLGGKMFINLIDDVMKRGLGVGSDAHGLAKRSAVVGTRENAS